MSGIAWLIPTTAAFIALALSPRRLSRRDLGTLTAALISLALPAWAALGVALLALAVAPAGRRWDVPALALLLALFRLRLQGLPQFSDNMGFWAALLALLGVMIAAQQLLAAESGEEAGRALAHGQAAWLLFGLLSPAPLGWSGALLLLWQQGVLRGPLARVLEDAPGRVVLAGLLFLGLAGGPPLSAFNAYFQMLAPLMTEGAAVTSMHARLFSGTGLLAVLAILALLYQTGAFGYFYWSRVLPSAPSQGQAKALVPQTWAWVAFIISFIWGLAEHWGWPGRLAYHALLSLGAISNP